MTLITNPCHVAKLGSGYEWMDYSKNRIPCISTWNPQKLLQSTRLSRVPSESARGEGWRGMLLVLQASDSAQPKLKSESIAKAPPSVPPSAPGSFGHGHGGHGGHGGPAPGPAQRPGAMRAGATYSTPTKELEMFAVR